MVNDITIITGIASIFIFLGLVIPFINAEYGTGATEIDMEGFEDDVEELTGESPSIISAPGIFVSVLSMFFWTFGAIPFWLDGVFLIFRFTFFITVARNIWIGGGG